MPTKGFKMSLCTAPVCFGCFHYRINKIRNSPNVAPFFQTVSQVHTLLHSTMSTHFRTCKKKKNKKKTKGKQKQTRQIKRLTA